MWKSVFSLINSHTSRILWNEFVLIYTVNNQLKDQGTARTTSLLRNENAFADEPQINFTSQQTIFKRWASLGGLLVGSVQCFKCSVPKYWGYWSHYICIWQLRLCVGVQNGLLKTKTKTKPKCKWSSSKIRLWLFPCIKLLHKSLKNSSSNFIFISKTHADNFLF